MKQFNDVHCVSPPEEERCDLPYGEDARPDSLGPGSPLRGWTAQTIPGRQLIGSFREEVLGAS